jgi:hypothetical protein
MTMIPTPARKTKRTRAGCMYLLKCGENEKKIRKAQYGHTIPYRINRDTAATSGIMFLSRIPKSAYRKNPKARANRTCRTDFRK